MKPNLRMWAAGTGAALTATLVSIAPSQAAGADTTGTVNITIAGINDFHGRALPRCR